MNILKTHGIKKHFAKFAALKGISMEVKQGEIRAIIGPNGAGKTTFFNVITGKLKPTEGADKLFEDLAVYDLVKSANLLAAENPKKTGVEQKSWASENLEYQPVGALMALLSQCNQIKHYKV